MRIWLLVWVISDMMIFKMNAIQNGKEINNNQSQITTNASFADDGDGDDADENPDIIVNLYDPDDRPTNDSKSNDEQKNKSNEQTEPPFMQLVIKNPDKIGKGHKHNYTTTTPASTTSENEFDSFNSTENPMEIEKMSLIDSNVTTPAPPLIPVASVKPSIKHNKDTQQKIIIRYAHTHTKYHFQKAYMKFDTGLTD